MDLPQVIVLALIQGITEFLPISSSAHLILPAELTDWPDQGLRFDVAVHLGSLTALVIYFRAELTSFAADAFRLRTGASMSLLSKVAVATIPAALAGLLFKPFVESELRTVGVIAVTTMAFAIPLWWADRRTTSERDEYALSHGQAVVIGLAQAMALVPGVSRSGVTITAALLVGLGRRGAARFSFLLAIPTIAGAALLTAVDARTAAEAVPWTYLGLGFVVSAVAAYVCIRAFVALVNRTGMTPYVVYRLALGAVLLWFLV
ncbi:MAG: undecaprenyl-diphosphate phosphatase [Gammaproteobacteria bacterium]|nr:undecaprenyl-diphosphate phosphatase [Gammaproteobacteria bacterium]